MALVGSVITVVGLLQHHMHSYFGGSGENSSAYVQTVSQPNSGLLIPAKEKYLPRENSHNHSVSCFWATCHLTWTPVPTWLPWLAPLVIFLQLLTQVQEAPAGGSRATLTSPQALRNPDDAFYLSPNHFSSQPKQVEGDPIPFPYQCRENPHVFEVVSGCS